MAMTTMPGSENKKARPGRLRIVAGKWRSRLLDIADVPGLRPTSERVRETLFNWLAPDLAGARCLDLFAGTGALGFEALSRGRRVSSLRGKVPSCDESDREQREDPRMPRARSSRTSTPSRTSAPVLPTRSIIIFLDPPFADDLLEDLCRLIDELDLLAPRGRVYLEQDKGKPEAKLPAGWTVIKNKTAGQVRYSLVEADNAKGGT